MVVGQLDQVNDRGSHESMDIASIIENLENQFCSLRTRIIRELSDKPDMTVQTLLDILTGLPLSLRKEYESSIAKCIPDMRKETQVNELFIVYLNPLTSFIDYELIEYVIKKFGSDALKRDMQSYCSELILFMRKTTIKQLINHLPGQTEIPPKFSLIEAKIDQNASECTLEELNVIRKRYCGEVKLSEIVFHLVAVVESNSFIVRWLVPLALISDIMKSARNLDQSFYQECRITSLTLDGMWLFLSEVEIDGMWSQVHISDTKVKDRFHAMYKQTMYELEMEEISVQRLSLSLADYCPRLGSYTNVLLPISEAFLNDHFPLSFIDFKILAIIIERFGSDCLKKVLNSYCNYISIYVKKLTAEQLITLSPEPSDYFVAAKCRMMGELSDYGLEKLFSFQTRFCTILNFNKVCFVMGEITKEESCSFTVSWLVPSGLVSDLIKLAGYSLRKEIEFFQEFNITSLHLSKKLLYSHQLTQFGIELKERYQQSQGLLSPIPLPTKKVFRLTMVKGEIVQQDHIKDRSVQMSIISRLDDILYTKCSVELQHIFKNGLDGGEIILIEGAPGSGKSTLTVHICQRWGKGELFQQFTVVILVQLRDPAVQRAQTIADLLPVENAEEIATELIATNGRGVLWVLDGWDELPPHLQQDSIFCEILPPKPSEEKLAEIKKDPWRCKYVGEEHSKESLSITQYYKDRLLNEASIIVTSHPISSDDLHPVVSSRIEVLGFTPEEQRQYFTECFKGDTKALEAVLEKIQENPVVQSICYLPLNAALIVHTFKYRDQSLPNTEYEIYLSVILSCIQRHYDREGRGHDLPRELASLDDLSRSEAVREPFQCLCELAYRGVMENKVTFSSSDLPQGSNTLSLLQAVESFLQSRKSVFYNFIHLSVQEVLSAYYIATKLSDSEQVSQFQQLFSQSRFAAVFQFYAAITKLKSPGIRQVIDRIVEAKSKPLLVSLLCCLHEAQDPALCLYVAERLEYKLNLGNTSLSLLYCLSVSFFLSCLNGNETSVHLDHCTIGDLGVKYLSKYLHVGSNLNCINKATIDLAKNEICEEGAIHIVRICYFIEHLYLSYNPIGDTGASLVSEAVRETTTLKTLFLNICSITSRGAEDLSRALAQNSSLEKLDISENNLGDEGISHVAEALKQNNQLKELWIGDCEMTDEGATSLASALTVNNSLKMLHMGGAKGALTEDGLSTIAQSLASKSLFVKLAIPTLFGSTIADRLSQEINEARKRNGLPPIEIQTAARITDMFTTISDNKFDAIENEGDLGWALVPEILNNQFLEFNAQLDDQPPLSISSLNETKRLLFQSCKDGCTGTVQHLLTQHSDLRDQINLLTDDDGNTALIIVSKTRHTGIVKLLLECGANVDHRNSHGWTALMKASENGDSKLEIIELLLSYGAQVDLQNGDGQSALMVAAQNSQAKVATKLVQEYGASVGLKQKHSSWTALMKASESGSIDIVKLLVEHGADDLEWALVLAILHKHNDIIELLLKHGAQVDDTNWSLFLDQPPLVLAIETGDADMVKMLLDHDATQGIDQAIISAIFNKNTEIIKILSERDAQVDEVDWSPLVEAVEKGDADIVELLLEHGAKQGIDWAMTNAILSKNADIIKILSERGAQVDEMDWSDQPPLVEAVERGDANIVKLLLEHGAEQEIDWAMTDAVMSEQTEIIQMLSEHGAQVVDDVYKDGVGEEPNLVTACKNGDTNVVKLLLEHGAKESEYCGWALTEAILHKHTEVVDLLLEHGVCVADDGDRLELDHDPAIVEASEKGDIDSLKLLLKYGEKEEYQGYLGWALCVAATLEIVSWLLENGAEADEINSILDEIPLVEVSSEGNIEAVKLMLNHGAKEYMPEALVRAIENKRTDMIKLLTQHGAHVDDESWFDFDAMPVLVEASMKSDIETVKLLLNHGAEKYLDWALEAASKGGHTEIVKLLFDYGVEVDNCDMFDTAALVEASRNGKTDTVRFLLEQLGIMNRLGLALRAASGEGHLDIVHLLSEYGNAEDLGYALFEASRSGHTEVIKFLIECDVFVDFQDEEQTTALIIAGGNGHTDSAELLIECGAEVNLQNTHGTSALMAASQANHTDVVKLLLKYGASVNLEDENGQTAAKITNNDDMIALFAAVSDDKFDAMKTEVDLHEEVKLTHEEEAHLIAIENAITETGMLDHTLVHGVFVGPPRSGKDSLMERLLGQAASKFSPSTETMIQESCTYAATIGQSNWTRLDYDEEALNFMKIASEDSSSCSLTIEGEVLESFDTPIADSSSAMKDSTSDAFDNAKKRTMHMHTGSTSEFQLEIDPQPAIAFQDETSLKFQIDKIEHIHRLKGKHKTPIEIFKEAIMKKGLKGLRKPFTNSWSLYLTNTGGQMEFQELLPLLVSGPSMFFITFQLHRDLNECFQVEYELPSGESSKCYESSLSILDSILQTLSTIAAMGTFIYKGLQKKCVPLKPKVFLIGTHKDLLDKKSAATIIDRIDAQLQTVIKSTSHYREGIIQFASKSRMIFTVNNLDPSDSDFQTIRSAVEKTVERGDYKMRSPAHWMIYSLVVRQLQNRVESYDECFAIAKECVIKDN